MLGAKHYSFGVDMVRQRHAYHRHVGMGDDFLHIAGREVAAVVFGKFLGALVAAGINGRHAVAAALTVNGFGVKAPDKARAEHGDFLHWGVFLGFDN